MRSRVAAPTLSSASAGDITTSPRRGCVATAPAAPRSRTRPSYGRGCPVRRGLPRPAARLMCRLGPSALVQREGAWYLVPRARGQEILCASRLPPQLFRHSTLVPAQLAIQGGGIDTEHLGGAGLVAALALQHPGDVGTLDHVERGVLVRPLRDERLGAALRQLVGHGREVDRRALAEHHRPLEGVLELAHVAGPVVGE